MKNLLINKHALTQPWLQTPKNTGKQRRAKARLDLADIVGLAQGEGNVNQIEVAKAFRDRARQSITA